jgi:hypothetical protein
MSGTMRAYNLFRHKAECGVYCAVPEDRAVPAFLSASAWEFTGKVDNAGALPSGFDEKVASAGVRFNGFYVYQAPPR